MKKVLITFLFMLGLMIPGAYGRTVNSIIQDYNSSAGVNVTGNALDVNVTGSTANDDVIYLDDADWAATDHHILIGGLQGANTITTGDVGPVHVDADGDLIVTGGGGTDINVNINDRATSTGVAIATVVLDDSPTSATSTNTVDGDHASVMWFFELDETDSGNDTSGAITVDYSYDNSTWVTDMPFYRGSDGTIVVTLAVCAGVSKDENVVIWLPAGARAVPYVRTVITATGSAAGGDDQIEVTAYVATQK